MATKNERQEKPVETLVEPTTITLPPHAQLTMLTAELTLKYNFRLSHLAPGKSGWDRVAIRVAELPLEEAAALVIADPTPKATCFATDEGRDWLGEAESSGQLLQRMAVMAVIAKLRIMCEEKPAFWHSCNDCSYLGKMERQESGYVLDGEDHEWVDLYACAGHDRNVTVTVRYGNGVEHAYRGYLVYRNNTDPHLLEAWRRYDEQQPQLDS